MKYKLRRNRNLAFQAFAGSLDRAEKKLPELVSDVVPHYSKWYEAGSMQDLADKLEFDTEAESEDEVLTESGEVIGHIEEEFCMSVLVCNDGSVWLGPEVRAMGNPDEMGSEEYA